MCDKSTPSVAEKVASVEDIIGMIESAADTVKVFIHRGPLIHSEAPRMPRADASLEERMRFWEAFNILFETSPLLWSAMYTLEFAVKELSKVSLALRS